MKITWLGTATIVIESGADKIMFDPFLQAPDAEHPLDRTEVVKASTIFITHGHMDHLASIPELIATTDVMVYCGQIATTTLIKQGVSMKQIRTIHYGDIVPVGKMLVKAYKGKHVNYGPWLILKTVINPRIIRYSHNLLRLAKLHRKFPEGDNTMAYEVRVEEKTVFVLGSLALADKINYPKDIDILILPYQGCSSLKRKATKIIRTLRPKEVILSHFDDAFPPISHCVNTRKFQLAMKKRMPHVTVIKPEIGQPVVLEEEKEDEI